MSCACAVRGLVVAGLAVAGCGDSGGREGPVTTSPITSATNATGDASGSGDGSAGPGGTMDGGSSSGGAPTGGSMGDTADTGVGPPLCSYTCMDDGDCTVDGNDIGLDCLMGECAVGCPSDDACIAFHSGWTLNSCTASSDCDFDACVVFDTGAGCALTPAAVPCADVGLVEIQRMNTEGASVAVCGQPSALCTDQGRGLECHVPCTPTSCGALTCGADGFCRCDDFVPCYTEQIGEICSSQGECKYACTTPADCPATNTDNDQAVCG